MDNLVQFEEDFNSRTKKLRSGPDRLRQTRLIPRSPDGDKNKFFETAYYSILNTSSKFDVDIPTDKMYCQNLYLTRVL